MSGNLIQANAIQIPLQDKSVQLCCFSPPYWGLRSYKIKPLQFGGDPECRHEWGDILPEKRKSGWHTFEHKYHSPGSHKTTIGSTMKKLPEQDSNHGQFCQKCGAWRGQLGLEHSIDLFLDHMMLVMAEAWRVLRDDGVVFINLGDSYAGSNKGQLANGTHSAKPNEKQYTNKGTTIGGLPKNKTRLRSKSLCLIPQKFAIRCQEAGWIIRSEIIWHKPNPMPESCKDRPTKAHEQVWMLTKQGKYFWDQEVVKEKCKSGPSDIKKMIEKKERIGGLVKTQTDLLMKASKFTNIGQKRSVGNPAGRNIRSVWTLATEPTPEAHFATWPSKLVEIMIRAGSKKGDVVFDPFAGIGTSTLVAEKLGRIGVGMDLSAEYLWNIAKRKIDAPMQKELF